MKDNKSKVTIIAIVALIVVCGGSFLGVRAITKDTGAPVQVNASSSFTTPTQSTTLPTTTAPTTTQPTTVPSTTEPTTVPSTESTTKAEPSTSAKTEESTTRNPYTTFANSGSATTLKPSTTAPSMVYTTKPKTTAPAKVSTTAPELSIPDLPASATPEEIVKSAAVFSEGFLGYQYDPETDSYFTSNDPWQRNFGFNELYDIGASFIIFYYDTFRAKFEYDNKDWMIQFWKGQYGFVFIGAEIGVYNKPTSRAVEHYDCASDEDSLKMSMTCYRKGKEIFERKYATYWWCTGFVPGKLDKFSDRSELSVKARLTMKDYKMLVGFCGALKENGFVLNKDYTTSGLDVYLKWQ